MIFIDKCEYSDEFTLECKRCFGLPPGRIKKILFLLTENNCLDLEKHLEETDTLKKYVQQGTDMTQRLIAQVNETTRELNAFKPGGTTLEK